ncbi:glucosaminidase domain-containing protein [Pelagibacteraceae bacterium]|nr:glucosaminidase domain-containing protein [Pelagibacteraceae bacterium]
MSRTYLSKLKRKINLSLLRLKDNFAYQKKLIKKKIKRAFEKFIDFIDVFKKFNNNILGKSNKVLTGPLKKHYNYSYAKGSVIAFLIFAILYKPDFQNSTFAKIDNDRKIIENIYLKEDILAIDENLYVTNKKPVSKKRNEQKPSEYSDRQILGFGNNISARTIISLFEEENYNLKDIREGKAVDPVFLSKLPTGIANIDNIGDRKKLFIKVILPLVIYENNKILEDRNYLNQISSEKSLSEQETVWLDKKLKEYKVKAGDIEELKKRMDVIPPSLAIAQAAYETGWGTSRFAMEGNSLYGARTWKKGKGIVPNDRREEQKFEVLSFKIIRASISSYKKNLNTHQSYNEFRKARAMQRKEKNRVFGLELSQYLNKYSEIGDVYVQRLKKIIEQNSLTDFDESVLSQKKKPNIV